MTLTEIASLVNLGTNNQLSLATVTLFMDSIQKNVFQKNQQAFLVYDQELTILTRLAFSSSAVDSGDIGQPLLGSQSGATGTVVALYSDYVTLSNVTGEFKAGEAAEINGAGNILTVSTEDDFQVGWRGPYTAPTDPACRKIWGVTKRPPHLFWVQYLNQCGYWYSIDGVWQTEDYRAFWGNRLYPFITGNTFDLSNEFLFSFDPIVTDDPTPYYWVYWKNPHTITDLSEEGVLLIPEAYHLNYANAVQQAGTAFLEKQPVSIDDIVKANLGGWINTLLAPFRSQWRGSNMTQAPGAFLS